MMHCKGKNPRARSGIVLIVALVLLAMFTVLAASFWAGIDLNLRSGATHRSAVEARFLAESGLAFATSQMTGISVAGPSEPNIAQVVYDHLSARLDGTENLAGQSVTLDGNTISVPSISLDSQSGSFSFAVQKVSDTKLRLTVTGVADNCARQVAVDYDIGEDTSVLEYAVASRSRVIVTDGVVIDGDIFSSWDRTNIGGYDIPPFLLEQDTDVVGQVKTVLSEDGFNEYDSGDYVEGEHEGLVYDEPGIGEYTVDDFDTSGYKSSTTDITTLAPPDYTLAAEPFPSPTNIHRRIDRPVYENRTFDNIYIPVGHNPKFVNCTFNSITYIDTNETKTLSDWDHCYYREHAIPGQEGRSDDRYNDHSNNVIFENCTFNGPAVTAVPRNYWWSKNALTFQGTTTFTNTYMPESTILAPNFGVDIGGRGYDEEENPDSVLSGVIVGGIVDIRGTANIEGTILSMYYPDTDRGPAARYYGSNIGCYGDGEETQGATRWPGNIRIVPRSENQLPYGIEKKHALTITPSSYAEPTQ